MSSRANRRVLNRGRRTWTVRGRRRPPLFVAAIALAVTTLTAAPQAASAAVTLDPGLPLAKGYPHLAMWWPDPGSQPLSEIARYDYVVLSSPLGIAPLRALDPQLLLLASGQLSELPYRSDLPPSDPYNATRLGAVSADWILTQAGSSLTADVDPLATTFAVADSSRFRTGDLIVIGDETCLVTGVGAATIGVRRGVARPASAHSSGTRVAAACSAWPGSVLLDIRDACPLRDVGHGPERYREWAVRRAAATYGGADWDGILIDRAEDNISWIVTQGLARSIDPDRSNAVPTSYTAFDAQWNAGAPQFNQALRLVVGPRCLLLVNSSVCGYYGINGSHLETFPKDSTTLDLWKLVVIGPRTLPHASYLEWCANVTKPNISTVQTHQFDGSPPAGWSAGFTPDYRKMRFGLATALMGDGFFSYQISTAGQGSLGLLWFDEYDNAGAGRGYLGQPRSQATQVGQTTWRRDFEGGIVLVNPGTAPETVDLGGTFRRIRGTQCPTVNDGSTSSRVTVPPKDGLVLLGAGVSVPPPSGQRTSITIRTSSATARAGSVPILSGTVAPAALVGKVVVVYVKRPGRSYWSYSSNRVVYSRYGVPSWQYKYYFRRGMPKGTYRFQAAFPGSAGLNGCVSPTSTWIILR